MKKLGLVGGMGPESTMLYYRELVYGVRDRVGAEFLPNLTIESLNVFEVLRLCGEERYEELTEMLLGAVRRLAAAGADFVALGANTPHIVFETLQAQAPVPLLSILDATREEAARRGFHRLGLLGTMFTMQGEFFRAPFEKNKMEIVTPTEPEMAWINQKISSELELGIVKEETLEGFQGILRRMKEENGIEAVILGCTELPLLLSDAVSPAPCLDTMRIHIRALIDRMLE